MNYLNRLIKNYTITCYHILSHVITDYYHIISHYFKPVANEGFILRRYSKNLVEPRLHPHNKSQLHPITRPGKR